jgi:hypothetical protein
MRAIALVASISRNLVCPDSRAFEAMKLGGFEPPTSWVRYMETFGFVPLKSAFQSGLTRGFLNVLWADSRLDTWGSASITGTNWLVCH